MQKLFNAFSAMRFDDPHYNIFAAPFPADGFTEHAERFADARRIAKEQLEDAAGLLQWRGYFQPFFRLLWQRAIFSAAYYLIALE
jgi:hypothetical protein